MMADHIMSPAQQHPASPPTTDEPRTPPAPTGMPPFGASILPTPPASIQKYSRALSAAIGARFEAVAKAGRNAQLPPDASKDPDYGYDEDPFDTRARLLLSFADHAASSSREPPRVQLPPTPSERRPKRVLDLGSDDEDTNVAILDSPGPYIRRRRWSCASATGASTPTSAAPSGLASAAMSRASSFSCCDTPSSEMSFEIGRTSDYLGLYGRSAPTVRTPPVPTIATLERRGSLLGPSASLERRGSLLASGTPLRPLTAYTPSPQPGRRRKRRSRNDGGAVWEEAPAMARTTSEMMLLEAGLASQRGRAGRGRVAV